jgi:hypothetical protein
MFQFLAFLVPHEWTKWPSDIEKTLRQRKRGVEMLYLEGWSVFAKMARVRNQWSGTKISSAQL